MNSNLSYKISDNELTIKIPNPFPINFSEDVVHITSITNNKIDKLLIDFSEPVEISMANLNELARLRVLSTFETIFIQFINVPSQIIYKMTKASLNRYYSIENGDEHNSQANKSAHCPSCGENLDDLVAPLEHKAEELAQVRTQLIHLEKLNSIGQLCAGVAHEFNNIMASMKGFAQLALESKDPDITIKALKIVDEQTNRAEKITTGLLSFSRKKSARKIPCHINELLEKQLFLLKNQLNIREIQLFKKLSPLPETLADPSQLDQVFFNLFTNAIHSMQDKGTLTVVTECLEDNIIIRISDTGCGMSQDVIDRIFDPFFTTKGALGGGDTCGTGLGLSISQGIVMGHDGDIKVESKENSHTTFTITLPVTKKTTIPLKDIAPKKRKIIDKMEKSKSILIIDDEKNITDMLLHFLNFKGHRVTVAQSAAEGIESFKNDPADIVLLDIVMPGMNGADAYIELKKLSKDIKVAVITGHTGKHLESLLNAMKQIGTIEIIRKPFDLKFISNYVASI